MLDNNKNIKPNNLFFPYSTLFNKYKIISQIGKGSFGTVYSASNIFNLETVAIKTEINQKNRNLLQSEYNKLNVLQGFNGIPKIYEFIQIKEYNILIMELLGKSLSELFILCKKKFSLKTVCFLAINMIEIMEYVHNHKIIHRDIKPDNYMIGRSKNNNNIYLIDFGLAKNYIINNIHIPFKKGKSMTGTARYCSVYTHQGIEQSRRDDLESIGYILIYFLRGNLPWQGIKAKEGEKHYERIGKLKESISIEELCEGFPEEIVYYFNYVKQLEFEDEPNYNFLSELFEKILKKYCGIKYNSNLNKNSIYDWNDLDIYKEDNFVNINHRKSTFNYIGSDLSYIENNNNYNFDNKINKKNSIKNKKIKQMTLTTKENENSEKKNKNNVENNDKIHCHCILW